MFLFETRIVIFTGVIITEELANKITASKHLHWDGHDVFLRFTFTLRDGFHSEVIKLQSQKSEALWILIYTRLKINRKEIFVQDSSPEVCFFSKIQQFELPSFHSAWNQSRNAVSLQKVSRLDFLDFDGHVVFVRFPFTLMES